MPRPLPSEAEAREILARRRTRPTPRPAPSAGRALQPLIKGLDQTFGRSVDALSSRWPEIVGEQLARVTRPQKLSRPRGRGGRSAEAASGAVLELRVAGAAALLVQHQSDAILQRVNLFLGSGAVERLTIAQGPVRPLPPPSVSTRGARRRIEPLSADQEAELARSLTAAPDALRAALTRMGRAVLAPPR